MTHDELTTLEAESPGCIGLAPVKLSRLDRELSKQAYAQAARLESRLGSATGRPQLAELRRVVQRLVDLVLDDDTTLLGLTAVKALRTPERGTLLPTHGVNVAVLSLVLAREVGLGREELVEVGLAALAHAAGPDSMADPTLRALRGAGFLLQMGPVTGVVRPVLAAVEQHAHEETPGQLVSPESRDLTTRIVQIARAYDALTAHGGREGRPDLVLELLLADESGRLDRTLLKLFAHAIGIYPPGTVVRLDGGEVGIVWRANRDPERLDRPHVRLLLDPSGQPLAAADVVDLAARDARGFVRSIAAVLDAEPLGVTPGAVFTGAEAGDLGPGPLAD
jgi:hypothetical protein